MLNSKAPLQKSDFAFKICKESAATVAADLQQ